MKTRVFMFSPGSDRIKSKKALESDADVVILDLEDAVAPSEKDQARLNVAEAVRTYRNRQVLVRINALSTPWALQDLLAIVPERPSGIVLPKSETASDIIKTSWVIDQLDSDKSAKDEKGIGLYPLIETAAGIAHAELIAQASFRVRRLIFGALDYSLDLGISYDRESEAINYARNRLVSASVQSKLPGPIDTVYPSVKDNQGLKQDSLKAKALGFKGKLIIHPGQIEIVKTVFTPSPAELEEAEEIVEVYQKAKSEGIGAVVWKGKMLDEPVLKRAQQIIEEFKE